MKKSQDFSQEDLGRLAESPTAKQLMSLLQGSDPEAFSTAMHKASKGDYSGALATLQKVMNGKEAQALLEKLGGSKDG